MKLRFRGNSLRLRVNRREVEMLAAGHELKERVIFAGGASLDYILTPAKHSQDAAHFDGRAIRVTASLDPWASGPEMGYYFQADAGLSVAIEKDLECVDGPEEEKDPHAYPRHPK